METLLFGTNNAHKLREIRQILERDYRIFSLADQGIDMDVEETGHTLEDNAKLKAMAYFDVSGIRCFSDDTGLEVESLDGAPGVYSARYAGPQCSFEDNVRKMLAEMESKTNRKAVFRTVIALFDGTTLHLFEGKVAGTITAERRGTSGFGYDPIFLPDGATRTFAEMTDEEKNAISHRGEAVNALCQFLLSEKQN